MLKRWEGVPGPQTLSWTHSQTALSFLLQFSMLFPACTQAPAVSIARSKQAIGQACRSLVGSQQNTEKNATRDVTTMLSKCGLVMNVHRERLVTKLCFCINHFSLSRVFSCLSCCSWWQVKLDKLARRVRASCAVLWGLHDRHWWCHWAPYDFAKLLVETVAEGLPFPAFWWTWKCFTGSARSFLDLFSFFSAWACSVPKIETRAAVDHTAPTAWWWRSLPEKRKLHGMHNWNSYWTGWK